MHRLVSYVGYLFLQLVGKTSFVHRLDHPASLWFRRLKKPVVYAFWHNSQVYLSYDHRNEPINVIVSRSKDGEYIAQVMNRMGLNAMRGSSSRGGDQAFRELLDCLKNGKQIGLTPDGPKGPVYKAQGGVVAAARLSGLPIIPTNVSSRRRLVFKSWDAFQVPLPFSQIAVAHGKPFFIPSEMDEDRAKQEVERSLNENRDAPLVHETAAPPYLSSVIAGLAETVYRVAAWVGMPIWLPLVLFSYGWKRARIGLRERLGNVHYERDGRPVMWFHAASIGEWQALKPLLAQMDLSQSNTVITTSAPEAKELIMRERAEAKVSLLPADVSFVVDKWLDRIRPDAAFIVETELWPVLLRALHRRYIPVFLVNGRLSQKSASGWKWVKPLSQRLLESFAMFYVRTGEDAQRFIEIGAPVSKVRVMGNLKIDNLKVAISEKQKAAERLWGRKTGAVVIGGSTWGDEEKMLLGLSCRLVLAPRRPERFDEVERLIEKTGRSWSRWSKIKQSAKWDTEILLLDTLGELKDMYKAADVAFIGGRIEPRGGQNPLEAAAEGLALVFGPSMSNFHAEAAALVEAGAAVQRSDAGQVQAEINLLAQDAARRERMAAVGTRWVKSQQGVAKKTADLLLAELGL